MKSWLKNYAHILIPALVLALLFGGAAFVNWWLSPMRGLGEVSSFQADELPDALTILSWDGGQGGLTIQVLLQPEAGHTYSFNNAQYTLERYEGGQWYHVKWRDTAYGWGPTQLEAGGNELYLPKGSLYGTLPPGIYRQICSFADRTSAGSATEDVEVDVYGIAFSFVI